MQREHILLGAAVAVVVAAGLVGLLAPDAFATPDEPVREDYLELREAPITPSNVTEDSATLEVTNWLVHEGGPSENVSLLVRAVDAESGLTEATTRRSVGVIEGDRDEPIPTTVTVERSGGYDIETLVFVDGERVATGTTSVSGMEGLQPASVRTGLRFHRFRGSLPTITYSASAVEDGTVTINTTSYLTNRGDDLATDLELTVRARQFDSNVIADRATVSVEDVRSGRTVTPDVALSVPDNYSYSLDAILIRDGVIVDTETAIADLDPTRSVEANETTESVEFSVSDFTGDGSSGEAGGSNDRVTTMGEETGGGDGPGFGTAAALLGIVTAALLATRWTDD